MGNQALLNKKHSKKYKSTSKAISFNSLFEFKNIIDSNKDVKLGIFENRMKFESINFSQNSKENLIRKP